MIEFIIGYVLGSSKSNHEKTLEEKAAESVAHRLFITIFFIIGGVGLLPFMWDDTITQLQSLNTGNVDFDNMAHDFSSFMPYIIIAIFIVGLLLYILTLNFRNKIDKENKEDF